MLQLARSVAPIAMIPGCFARDSKLAVEIEKGSWAFCGGERVGQEVRSGLLGENFGSQFVH